VNRADRIAQKLQAEKAAQRHQNYLERLRAQRAEERSAEQRSAVRREQRLDDIRQQLVARRFAERTPLRAETALPSPTGASAPAPNPQRTTDRSQHNEDRRQPLERQPRPRAQQRRNPREDKPQRLTVDKPYRERATDRRPEGRPKDRLRRTPTTLGAKSRNELRANETPLPQAAVRQSEVRRRTADRKDFHARRAYQELIRNEAASQRVTEHQQLRGNADATRQRSQAVRQERATQRTGDRSRADEARQRRIQVLRALGNGRVQQHQQLRAEKNAVRAQKQSLRKKQADARNADLTAFHEERAQREQARRDLGAQRIEQHRDLRAKAQSAKGRVAMLRREEASRRAEDRRSRIVVAGPAQPRTISRLESTSTPLSLYQEPADSLLWLRTVDSFVVNENGKAISLRGVNLEGLDTVAPAAGQTVADALSLDDWNLTTLTDLWGVNVVRIPFQPSTILSGTSSIPAVDLLAGLDDAINALAEANVYTLLALRVPVTAGASTAPLPDSTVFSCWNLLAQHYQDEPAVLFEIFASALPIQGDWASAAPVLIGAIRSQHPGSLLFVGNGSASIDTSGLPLRFTTGDPTPNVVYTIRVADPCELSPSDENTLSALAKSFPIFASDWSDTATNDVDRSAEFAANLFAREGAGWAAGSWNTEPKLVRNSSSHDFVATRWGSLVQRAMILPTREPLSQLLPDQAELG